MTILKTRTRWVGVLLLASCTLVGSSALAQEEATSEDKQQLTTEVEIMKALRAGKWNAEQVETLILGLEEKGYARAAAWWADGNISMGENDDRFSPHSGRSTQSVGVANPPEPVAHRV